MDFRERFGAMNAFGNTINSFPELEMIFPTHYQITCRVFRPKFVYTSGLLLEPNSQYE